jgi:hypothetical protein
MTSITTTPEHGLRHAIVAFTGQARRHDRPMTGPTVNGPGHHAKSQPHGLTAAAASADARLVCIGIGPCNENSMFDDRLAGVNA